jgi:hypothetical protein
MTDIEDLRQVARIARGEGWALDVAISLPHPAIIELPAFSGSWIFSKD